MDKELMPVLHKIVTDAERSLSSILGTRVTVRLEINRDNLTVEEAQRMMLQELICREFDCTWQEVIGNRRLVKIVDARSA